jgi:hypothetical protein
MCNCKYIVKVICLKIENFCFVKSSIHIPATSIWLVRTVSTECLFAGLHMHSLCRLEVYICALAQVAQVHSTYVDRVWSHVIRSSLHQVHSTEREQNMSTTAPYADNGNTLMSTFRVATGQRVSLAKAVQPTMVDTYVPLADLGLAPSIYGKGVMDELNANNCDVLAAFLYMNR